MVRGKVIKLNKEKTAGILLLDEGKKIKFKITSDNVSPIFLYRYYKLQGNFIDDIFVIENSYNIVEEITVKEVTELFPSITPDDLKNILDTFNTIRIGDLLALVNNTEFQEKCKSILGEEKAKIFLGNLYDIETDKEYIEVWDLFNKTNTTVDITTVVKITNALKHRAALNETTVAEIIRKNPWIITQIDITDIFDSISQALKVANNIAKHLGYHENDRKAIISYAIAVTNLYTQNGNSYIPYYTLLNRVSQLTKLDRNEVANILKAANDKDIKTGYLIRYNVYKDELEEDLKNFSEANDVTLPQYAGYSVYTPKIFHMERYISKTLGKIIKSDYHMDIKEIKLNLENFIKENHLILTDKQKEAIFSLAENKITIINGKAGTGKSTVIKALKKILESMGYDPVILAPTGVASQRIAPGEGATIHRYAHIFEDTDPVFDSVEETKEENRRQTENEKKVIIVDEMSMITVPVLARLLSASSNAEAFVFVGDSNQLPPIGAGGVFEALISLGNSNIKNIKTVTLDTPFRSTNTILENAERVLKGEEIIEDSNLQIIEAKGWKEISQKVVEVIEDLINKEKVEYTDILVLSNKRGEEKNGTSLLNNVIREKIFNIPPAIKYSAGDIVITTRNDYNEYDTIKGGYFKSKTLQKYLSSLRNPNRPTIFNGTIGIIKTINDDRVIIEYKNPVTVLAEYHIEELDWYIEHGFAITIHKAQGGQAKYIIFATDEPEKISREMLYTVITRSKNGKVFLIGGTKESWKIKRKPGFILSKLKYKILAEIDEKAYLPLPNVKQEFKKIALIE
ncbi:AAA family ATPase [Caldanaerobacter subterraneus]|uniref:AAA family ATPase n=1 Tax=Caldanaerobacter subterraneus TaxID=911092 RepID=A0A7Y2PM96_9THEO|nr:AAA family ATPase [Caldanaerobacter subterraneus]